MLHAEEPEELPRHVLLTCARAVPRHDSYTQNRCQATWFLLVDAQEMSGCMSLTCPAIVPPSADQNVPFVSLFSLCAQDQSCWGFLQRVSMFACFQWCRTHSAAAGGLFLSFLTVVKKPLDGTPEPLQSPWFEGWLLVVGC